MAKTIYIELDNYIFEKIKMDTETNGIIDEKKYFKNLEKGDSVIFSSYNDQIEAKLIDIIIYNSLDKLIKDINLPYFSLICNDPNKAISIIKSIESNKKKIRIFKVKYIYKSENTSNIYIDDI